MPKCSVCNLVLCAAINMGTEMRVHGNNIALWLGTPVTDGGKCRNGSTSCTPLGILIMCFSQGSRLEFVPVQELDQHPYNSGRYVVGISRM